MIDPKALLADLKGQVKALETDLRLYGVTDSTTATELKREWQAARDAQRTAASYEMWLEDRVTQVAVAWVLGTVFVRFCEDNGLIEYPLIAGPGDRVAIARDRQAKFFEESPELTDRDWIIESFNALSVSPVAARLFEWHNPMWSILPSHDAAKALLAFWRDQDANAQIVHDFTDETWNTRFLGDLYQDLSEYAKKTYALLQTPVFVEEFILNYTLDPAIEEFGLEPEPPYGHPDLPRRLRVIDPACGSGHFLLGAFNRLLIAWQNQSGDTDQWVLIARALESVHGVDKNPFAVAIARFRLLLAAMQVGSIMRLSAKVDFPLNIAIGDSLLHGRGGPGIQTELELFGEHHTYTYRTEDVDDYIKSVDILGVGSYHVVVGNPPYITVKDRGENKNYRAYKSCSGKYHLSVPFAERIFQLTIRGAQDGRGAGYVGEITDNAFMKREFGKKLIEEYFPNIDLTHVIDTSGAYIPGHGTPTVILIGRRRYARPESTIRVVLGVRGEPDEPLNPALGLVWQAIVDQVGRPGSESAWVSVVDMPRNYLAKYPWSLSGGGAREVAKAIDHAGIRLIEDVADAVGIMSVTGEDDLYLLPRNGASRRLRLDKTQLFITGDVVRDYVSVADLDSVWMYSPELKVQPIDMLPETKKYLTPYYSSLSRRRRFGTPMLERGLTWYEWQELYVRKLASPTTIAFAEVATHSHFVLDRGGKVFNRTAPVIKLPKGASEDDHLALLGVLNSSTACFWLKQVSQNKGNRGGERSTARYAWESFYEFTGTKLEQFPLPADLPTEFGRELDELAQKLISTEPSSICAEGIPTRNRFDKARGEHKRIWQRMISLQEELDWDVYCRYGLLDETEAVELIARRDSLPELELGERAFEIRLALDGQEPEWFKRHRSKPITKLPAHWPDSYKRVIAKRVELIKNRPRDIGLIERPECKRRWESEPWEKKEQAAVRNWLLDRCEGRDLWYVIDHQGNKQPRPMTVNRLADRLRGDPDVVSVARLFGGPDVDLADVLKDITADEHVPYLSQLRYSGTGLLKRLLWEKTWDQQREEDRTGQRLDIPMPPKYKKEDFLRTPYWNQRAKLDVARERFVSYPGASPDSDDSLLLGWAGWDHREQAHALIALIEERSTTDGWEAEQLKPLLAGLLEVMPWVRQWHDEVDPAFGASPAHEYDTYLRSQREKYGLTEDDLRGWTPPAVRRGRRRGGGGA